MPELPDVAMYKDYIEMKKVEYTMAVNALDALAVSLHLQTPRQ